MPSEGIRRCRLKRTRAKPSEGSVETTVFRTPNASAAGEVANQVLVEAGAGSGREPSEVVQLRSYLGQFLSETGRSLGAGDADRSRFAVAHIRETTANRSPPPAVVP